MTYESGCYLQAGCWHAPRRSTSISACLFDLFGISMQAVPLGSASLFGTLFGHSIDLFGISMQAVPLGSASLFGMSIPAVPFGSL